jgi:hypothetical protein
MGSKVPAFLNKNSDNLTCLVLSEGYDSESLILLEFAVECALKNRDVVFILRLHPLTSFKSLERKSPKLRSLPFNVKHSNSSLNKDLSVSSWALYRGTTSIISAVKFGLFPIYFKTPNEITIDPLFGLKSWRKVVENKEEFSNAIDYSRKMTNDQWRDCVLKAIAYCDGIYSPLDSKVLLDIVSNVDKIKIKDQM